MQFFDLTYCSPCLLPGGKKKKECFTCLSDTPSISILIKYFHTFEKVVVYLVWIQCVKTDQTW